MQTDERSFRVALVADELVNVAPGRFDALAVLEQAGWGATLLPAAWYPAEVGRDLLEQIAEQVEEFTRHGYDVVVVGSREGLSEALATVGVELPDAIDPAGPADLEAFLAARQPA